VTASSDGAAASVVAPLAVLPLELLLPQPTTNASGIAANTIPRNLMAGA
jgi:hypothetical protein